MLLLLSLLSIVFGLLSACTMCFLSMATELGPWIAPVFTIVVLVLMLPFFRQHWFKGYAIKLIASASIGGVVGMAVGMTWPAIYFLHEKLFLSWMQAPIWFALQVASVIVAAGSLGFLLAYMIKDHLIVDHQLKFPMSQLVYKVLYIDQHKEGLSMLLQGVMASSGLNVFLWAAQGWVYTYMSTIQMVPLLTSIGFVAGESITIPLLIGAMSRMLLIDVVRDNFFELAKTQEFMVTFCSGMVLAIMLSGIWRYLQGLLVGKHLKGASHIVMMFQNAWKHKIFRWLGSMALICCCTVLQHWEVSILQQIIVLIGLYFLTSYVAMIVGTVGVIELDKFMWFLVLPLVYALAIEQLPATILAVFVTICLGVVVDLLFSYKLAHLADIAYDQVLKYQLLAFVAVALAVGIVLGWYVQVFGLGTPDLFAQKAQEQASLINLGIYNYTILLLGFVYALIVRRYVTEILVVVGGLVMSVDLSFWLIFAGALSYLVPKRENFFVFWFGVYASHSLLMMIRAFM